MSKMDTHSLGEELSEHYGYKVDIAGHLSDVNESGHMRRLEAMLDKVTDKYIPEDEEVRDLNVRFNPWSLPEVKVWCKSNGFEYANSQVHDARFMVNGRLYRFKVDVRPF